MFQLLVGSRVPFMRCRNYAYVLSGLLIVAGLASVLIKGGFRLGVDFAGGVLVEYRFDQVVQTDELRSALSEGGFAGAEIQASEGGRTFLIRIRSEGERIAGEAAPSERILQAAQKRIPGLGGDLLREEVVGPRVGRELRGKAFWAVLLALLGILIYVGVSYEFKYAFGGVVALGHDVMAVLAFISFANKEITIAIFAGVLTIAGYSINDTIVIFDRIRERTKGLGRPPDAEVFDLAINQTLSRTIITALTVLFTVEVLYFMGGEVIHDFAFAMLVGTVSGTYSTVFIASAIALSISNANERRKTARQAQAARLKT